MEKESCEVRDVVGPTDPEDGITYEVNRRLKERNKADDIGVWEDMWSLLFPEDEPLNIPQPGE